MYVYILCMYVCMYVCIYEEQQQEKAVLAG